MEKGGRKFKATFLLTAALVAATYFAPEATATAIDCEFDDQFWIFITEDSFYFCSVINTDIFDGADRLVVDEVRGNHTQGKDNTQVQGININAPNMKDFPANLDTVFPNLIAISLIGSKIATVTGADLRPFAGLKYLFLQENKIETIDSDMFGYNPDLEVIHLPRNRINRVDGNTVRRLQKLRVLDLTGNNKCNSFKLYESRKAVEKAFLKVEDLKCISFNYETSVGANKENSLAESLQQCEEKNKELTITIDKLNGEIEALKKKKIHKKVEF